MYILNIKHWLMSVLLAIGVLGVACTANDSSSTLEATPDIEVTSELEPSEASVLLRWKVPAGDFVGYTVSMSAVDPDEENIVEFDIGALADGQELPTFDFPDSASLIMVLQGLADGGISVNQAFTDVSFPMASDSGITEVLGNLVEHLIGTMRTAAEINENGEVTSEYTSTEERNALSILLELPKEPVKVGDTWTLDLDLVSLEEGYLLDETLETNEINQVMLVSIAIPNDGETIATVKYVLEESISGELATPIQGGPSSITGSIGFVGSGEFLVERGVWKRLSGRMQFSSTGVLSTDIQQHLSMELLDEVPETLASLVQAPPSQLIGSSPYLYRVNEEDITAISVVHQGVQVDYELQSGQWVIKDGNDTTVYIDKWSGTPLLLSGPQTSRALNSQIDDPAKYGLDSPQTVVKLTTQGGDFLEIHLGDPTPDGENWYVRLADDDELFLVAGVWGEVISRLATKPPYAPKLFSLVEEDILGISVTYQGEQIAYALQDGRWVIKNDVDIPVFAEAWNGVELVLEGSKTSEVTDIEIDDPDEYGLLPGYVFLNFDTIGDSTTQYFVGDLVPDTERRYAASATDERLFTVPDSWAEALSKLVTDPPYPPGLDPNSEDAVTPMIHPHSQVPFG